MPSSAEKRLEQQRARRAAAAAAKAVVQAASMCDGSGGKLTSTALPEASTSVMHTDLDDLATTTDVGAPEQQWRGGANRQAQPDAHEHQLAASRAAAQKRSAEAAPIEERAAKRNAVKRDKRAREATVAALLNELIDEVVDVERKEDEEREDEVANVLYDLNIDKVIEWWMIDEQPTRKRLNEWLRCTGDDAIDDSEYTAFIDYLHEQYLWHGKLEPEDYERDAFLGLFLDDWRGSDECTCGGTLTMR